MNDDFVRMFIYVYIYICIYMYIYVYICQSWRERGSVSTRKGIMCQLTNRGGLATIFYAATSDNATTMYIIKPSVTCLNIYI